VIAGVSEGNERYEELHRANVDDDTAVPAALVHGAVNAGAQMVPMGGVAVREGGKALVRTAAGAAARAAAVGAGQEVVDDSATEALLKEQGYPELAEQYAPTTAKAAEGAAFMAGLHVGTSAVHGWPPGARPRQPTSRRRKGTRRPSKALPWPTSSPPCALRAPWPTPRRRSPSSRVAADAQRTAAATKLDGAQTVDEMAAAASELASRPNADVEARVAQTASQAQDAAGAAAEDALHTAASDKLNEALDAEAETARAKLAEQEKTAVDAESTPNDIERAHSMLGKLADGQALTNDEIADARRMTGRPEPLASPQAHAVTTGDRQTALDNLRSALGYVPDLVHDRLASLEQRATEAFGGREAAVRDPVGYAHTLTQHIDAEARAIRDRPQPGVQSAVGHEVVDRIGAPANDAALGEPVMSKGETGPGHERRAAFSQDPAHLSFAPDRRFALARTVGEAVRHAARTGNEFAKLLAERLLPYVEKAPFRVVEPGRTVEGGVPTALNSAHGVQWTHVAKGMDGVWVKSESFGPDQGVNNAVVLHEALHQATVRKIGLGLTNVARGTRARQACRGSGQAEAARRRHLQGAGAQGKIPPDCVGSLPTRSTT
jgi:hypothetical protein